jgi:hypothetical protein
VDSVEKQHGKNSSNNVVGGILLAGGESEMDILA